jgi:acetyl-CoA carboxylase carboxyltransferase component
MQPKIGKKNPKLYDFLNEEGNKEYEVRELIKEIVDADSFCEYKAEYGKALVCAFARVGGHSVGIVANQRHSEETAVGAIEIGGVIYKDSADKAARFILECNQMQVPILFFQDVMGFMVGKEAEASGIIKSGAKLVNAISNSVVPKITIILGNSFGAGHYALCGKAYDPTFIFAWPSAKYAVMGAGQAKATLQAVQGNKGVDEVEAAYEKQMDIRYGAARGWIDAIIDPAETRNILFRCLPLALRNKVKPVAFQTGVLQL